MSSSSSTSSKRIYQGMALAALAAFIWSGNFIVARAVIREISPVSLAFFALDHGINRASSNLPSPYKRIGNAREETPALLLFVITIRDNPFQHVRVCGRSLFACNKPRVDWHNIITNFCHLTCRIFFERKDPRNAIDRITRMYFWYPFIAFEG